MSRAGSSVTSQERFQIYRGQAALGALVAFAGMTLVPIFDPPPKPLTDIEHFWLAFSVAAVAAFVMVCRTAFKRGEYLSLAILYACGKGAFIGGCLPAAIGLALFSIGIEPSMEFQTKLVLLSATVGSVMNIYAKYLSPDCARVE